MVNVHTCLHCHRTYRGPDEWYCSPRCVKAEVADQAEFQARRIARRKR